MDLTNKKIIIDTDIGDDIDDAYAILYLYSLLKDNIIGITTVFKNTIERAKITKYLIKNFNSNIKVYAGIDKPIKEPIKFLSFEKETDHPHIKQYQSYMESEIIDGNNAVDFIIDSSIKYGKDLIIIAIGPLTNLACAYLKNESAFNNIGKLIIMGGTFDSEYAEWNFRCDPEASKLVLESKVETYLVGHELTKSALLEEKDLDTISSIKNISIEKLMELTNIYENCFNPKKLPVLHDPLCSSVLFGDFITFEDRKIYVETKAPKRAVVIYSDSGKLCHIGVKANYKKFFEHLINTFKKIEKGGNFNV